MPKVDQETLTAFGIAVRNAKDRKGWTLDELSTELGQGNSKSFLSRIQNGKSDISARTAARLIDKLGLEDSWFDAFATSETSEDEEITPTDARADQLLEAAEESGAYSRLEAAGISEITIIELAQKASSEVEDVSQAWAQLQELTDVAVRVQEEGRTKSNHPDFIDTVLARAADLAAKGDYATAGDELDAALEEEREASTARQQKLLTRAIDMARLDGNAQRAARIIVSLEDLNAGGTASLGSLRATQDEYDVRGKNKGILLDQRIAIAIAEAILPRATTSEERVTLLDDLGIALAHLGERESGTQRLEQAVTAYENALKEWTREKVPLQWATTQNNLGTALQRLGERESGTQRLEQAVTAYENALKEWTKEKVPLQWATIQNNLGDALRSLGDRESGI